MTTSPSYSHSNLAEPTVEALLQQASSDFVFVLVPGLQDSGPEHWQSCWHTRFPAWLRMAQRNWSMPDLEGWVGSIRRTLGTQSRPAILIGHSMGALASCALASRQIQNIAGVMLVAPAEPARFELEEQIPVSPLPCPSILVASHDDPLMRFDRAEYWAGVWGSRLADIGEAGHINVESGYGLWPHGLHLLADLVKMLDC